MRQAIATICVVFFFLLACPNSTFAKEPACNAERWNKTIAKFAQADEKNPPKQGGVVLVGSSSIRMWKLAKYFPELEMINRGFGGSEICDSTEFLHALVVKHRPRVVVLYAGDNDVASGKSAAQVHRDFLEFWKKLHLALPETRLNYIAIKPSIARWKLAPVMKDANQRIATDCEAVEQLTFVDIWQPMLGDDGRPREELFLDDGLHMSDAGYQIWTKLLSTHLVDHHGTTK